MDLTQAFSFRNPDLHHGLLDQKAQRADQARKPELTGAFMPLHLRVHRRLTKPIWARQYRMEIKTDSDLQNPIYVSVYDFPWDQDQEYSWNIIAARGVR